MKRTLLTIAIVGLAMLAAKDAFAGPFCWFGRRAAAPAVPVATAQAQGGYRAYSYEPGMTQPAPRARVRTAKPGYMDARTKALGAY
jgi:hypothetical protein